VQRYNGDPKLKILPTQKFEDSSFNRPKREGMIMGVLGCLRSLKIIDNITFLRGRLLLPIISPINPHVHKRCKKMDATLAVGLCQPANKSTNNK